MAEILISVDIEASGPIPGEYSMLALGACVVGAPEQSFYVELKPLHGGFQEEALATLCWWKSTWVYLISPCMRKDLSAPREIPSPGCPPMWPMATSRSKMPPIDR